MSLFCLFNLCMHHVFISFSFHSLIYHQSFSLWCNTTVKTGLEWDVGWWSCYPMCVERVNYLNWCISGASHLDEENTFPHQQHNNIVIPSYTISLFPATFASPSSPSSMKWQAHHRDSTKCNVFLCFVCFTFALSSFPLMMRRLITMREKEMCYDVEGERVFPPSSLFCCVSVS